MPFTLPWGINYFVSTNINNGNAITGTSGSVSLKVNGNTELAGTLIVGDLGLTKFPTCTDAATPTSTNLITKSYADANYAGSGILTTANTWTDVNTFQKPIVLSNKITGQTAQIYSITTSPLVVNLAWASAENVIIIPAATGSGTQAIVNLPSIATANIGASFLIMTGGLQYAGSDSVLIQNSNTSFNLLYENNQYSALCLDMGTGFYPTSPYGYRFTAINTSQGWVAAPFDFKKTAITYSGNVWQGTNSYNSYLPTSTIATTTSGTQFMTRNLNDARYGQLASTNTWTDVNTFQKPIVFSNNITGQKAQIYTVSATQLVINPAWGSEENIIIIPSGTGSVFGVGYVNLPSITSSNIGTTFYITQGGVGNASSDYIQIGTVAGGTTLLYRGVLTTSVYIDMGSGVYPTAAYGYKATAKDTSQTWIISALDFNANQLLNGTNTWSYVQTFSSAPVMSGASISSATIPNSALQSTVTLNNTASTFSAKKTFTGGIDASGTQTINFGTNSPSMSGAGITAGSILYTSLATNDLLNKVTTQYSLVAGESAGNSTGLSNTLYGYSSGLNMATGANNCFFGSSSGRNVNGAGGNNTAIGSASMGGGGAGQGASYYNTAIGSLSLITCTTGQANTAIGYNSIASLTTGSSNTFIGNAGGYPITTGSFNSGIGEKAGFFSDCSRCTFLGAYSDLTTSGLTNVTCVGYGTTCGVASTIQLGSNSETVAISGSFKSGSNTITATQLGYLSGVLTGIVDLSANQTIGGTKTFSVLPVSSVSSTTGGTQFLTRNLNDARYGQLGTINTWSLVQTFNSAPVMSGASIQAASIKTGLVGTANESAIKDLYIDTSANCALGNDSMISITTGVGNCALSTRALKYCTTGDNNMGIGTQALSSLTSGIQNVGISTGALQSYNGSSTVGIGAYSGSSLTSGDENVMIGYYSGGSTTTASSTVCIGNNAGSGSTTLNSCVFIGNATTTTGTKTNVIVIGAAQATASNDCIIGDVNNNVKIAGTLAVTGTINSVSSTVFGYISGLTSSAQTQINNILNGTSAITLLNYNSVYRPYTVASIAAGATSITSPFAGTYLWSASGTASTNTTITLPSITTAMIGITLRFRRIANATSTNALLVLPNTTGTNLIYPLGSVTTQTTSTTVIFAFNTSTFGQNGYSGTLACVNSTTWAVL